MESNIKRQAIRKCLESFAKCLAENNKNTLIINDCDVEFYNELAPIFGNTKFDYISLAHEDAFYLTLGLLELQADKGQNDSIILFADHSSAHRINPFTISDMLQRAQDVTIVILESYLAKRSYFKQAHVTSSKDPSLEKEEEKRTAFFDFKHSFLYISHRLHARFISQASPAKEEDLAKKAYDSINCSSGSALVIHVPSRLEDDNMEMLNSACECGLVTLFEKHKDEKAKITYIPSFQPSISEFLMTNAFFEGITEKQVSDVESHYSVVWEDLLPGKFKSGPRREEKDKADWRKKHQEEKVEIAQVSSAAVEKISYSRDDEIKEEEAPSPSSPSDQSDLPSIGDSEEAKQVQQPDEKPPWEVGESPITEPVEIEDEVEKVEYHPPKKKYKKDIHGKGHKK